MKSVEEVAVFSIRTLQPMGAGGEVKIGFNYWNVFVLFIRDLADIYVTLSVRPSVRPSVKKKFKFKILSFGP